MKQRYILKQVLDKIIEEPPPVNMENPTTVRKIRIFFYCVKKTTAQSKFLLCRPKKAQLVKIPFIVFRLTRLVFTSQTNHLDTVYL